MYDKLSDFDYYLPPELIAQSPAKPRDRSRLLLLDRQTGALRHERFDRIINFLSPGDVLVVNDSRVFPARLIGRKPSGGRIEVFLLRRLGRGHWQCLVGGRARPSQELVFPAALRAVLLTDRGDNTWDVKFNLTGKAFEHILEKVGQVPLPPYIKRDKRRAEDKQSYQTVFADLRKSGSAAAPTAGLHFTPRLLKRIQSKGVKIVKITLHVGLGTFAPVKSEDISLHRMHSEWTSVSRQAIRDVLEAKKSGGRVIAVGTTSCRTLESLDWQKIRNQAGQYPAQNFATDIFIRPGYRFRIVDALITNFHLPKSTLLMLVSALAGKEKIERAYAEAVKAGYRFFSYGDAMFIF